MNFYKKFPHSSCGLGRVMVPIILTTLIFLSTPVATHAKDNIKNNNPSRSGAAQTHAHTHASSNSAINSAMGLLAIYRQESNDKNSIAEQNLRNNIAAFEMDLSNPYLSDHERKALQGDLERAENELLKIINKKPAAGNIANAKSNGQPNNRPSGYAYEVRILSEINSLLGIDNVDELDIREASGQ